jgi:deoxyribodipyrimidine photolyase
MTEHTAEWFRQDLRIQDILAVAAATYASRPVIPLFIHAPLDEGTWAPGGASNWWLFHALADLREELGQLGPRQVWHAVRQTRSADLQGGYAFLSGLARCESAYHLLFHFPATPNEALNRAYRSFPWAPDHRYLEAWQKDLTGCPIVDAGMRQLWRTGWMHNRVRMIKAFFLVKHWPQLRHRHR